MKRTDNAKAYRKRLLGDRVSSLAETDPEYIERFENFAFDEVIHQGDLDERTRMMAILAALLGCQGIDAFEGMVEGALNLGVTPVEIKEIVYQGTAYLGFGKVLPFLHKVNDVLKSAGSRCHWKDRRPRRWKTVWKRASRHRSISLANRCAGLRPRDHRRAATSIAGFRITALGTITPGAGWIIVSGR